MAAATSLCSTQAVVIDDRRVADRNLNYDQTVRAVSIFLGCFSRSFPQFTDEKEKALLDRIMGGSVYRIDDFIKKFGMRSPVSLAKNNPKGQEAYKKIWTNHNFSPSSCTALETFIRTSAFCFISPDEECAGQYGAPLVVRHLVVSFSSIEAQKISTQALSIIRQHSIEGKFPLFAVATYSMKAIQSRIFKNVPPVARPLPATAPRRSTTSVSARQKKSSSRSLPQRSRKANGSTETTPLIVTPRHKQALDTLDDLEKRKARETQELYDRLRKAPEGTYFRCHSYAKKATDEIDLLRRPNQFPVEQHPDFRRFNEFGRRVLYSEYNEYGIRRVSVWDNTYGYGEPLFFERDRSRDRHVYKEGDSFDPRRLDRYGCCTIS